VDEVQMRQGHWVVVDLIRKGGHIRTVPIPEWVKAALDQWTVAAGVREGRIFRAVARTGRVWGKGISQNVEWYVVKTCCERAGLEHIAPHELGCFLMQKRPLATPASPISTGLFLVRRQRI
jgi:site-specific recombinase XerD